MLAYIPYYMDSLGIPPSIYDIPTDCHSHGACQFPQRTPWLSRCVHELRLAVPLQRFPRPHWAGGSTYVEENIKPHLLRNIWTPSIEKYLNHSESKFGSLYVLNVWTNFGIIIPCMWKKLKTIHPTKKTPRKSRRIPEPSGRDNKLPIWLHTWGNQEISWDFTGFWSFPICNKGRFWMVNDRWMTSKRISQVISCHIKAPNKKYAPENGHILPSFTFMISPCFMIFYTHVNDSMMVMDHFHRLSPGKIHFLLETFSRKG